jgi:hypothetical protein
MRQTYKLIAGALALCLVACDTGSHVTEITATGGVKGVTYIDRNGNGILETLVDVPLQGVAVKFTPFGVKTGEARGVSNALGSFVVLSLDVGEYAVTVDNTTVPDSLRVTNIDSAKVTVSKADTSTVMIALSYPTFTVRSARQQPTGKRLFIEGVTLNSWTTYGDSTLHVADSSGVMRVTRVAAVNVPSGMKVRILGTTDIRDGQRTLTDATAFTLQSAQIPAPSAVTTAVATKADGGKLDAALVSIANAQILGAVTTTAADVVLTVNDGSGNLEVMIDRNTGISPTPYAPGAILTATGILVPSDKPGEWQLKPRAVSDLNANFPAVTVAQARQLELGRIVTIEGVALNSWVTFGDSTVHLADSTGTIRATRVQNAILLEGQRVRLLGAIGFRDGQPTLLNVTPTVLGNGVLPLPKPITTATGVTADSGKADAVLVKVFAGTIADTATVAGDFRLHVNDGSGKLEVLLDKDTGFQLPPFIPGAVIDVTGLLVPIPGTREWRLKPRKQADLIVVR